MFCRYHFITVLTSPVPVHYLLTKNYGTGTVTIVCLHSHLSTSVSGLSVSAAVSCPSTVSSPSDLFSCSSWSLSSCFFFFFLLFLSQPSPLYSYCKRSECGVLCSVQIAEETGHLLTQCSSYGQTHIQVVESQTCRVVTAHQLVQCLIQFTLFTVASAQIYLQYTD